MYTRLTGISVPQKQCKTILKIRPPLAWLELNTDEYIEVNEQWEIARTLREDYPLYLRGIGLSLGSADALNWQYLKKLKELKDMLDPCLIADHLAWSSVNGRYFHVPLPITYSNEMLNYLCMKIEVIQTYLQKSLLISNICHYEETDHSEKIYAEAEFLCSIAEKTGCQLAINLTNLTNTISPKYLSLMTYLSKIPKKLIEVIHLTSSDLSLYREAIKWIGVKPTIIDWQPDEISCHDIIQAAFSAEEKLRKTHVATPEPT